jgi:tetratricopeptide (TPR) repeat protein
MERGGGDRHDARGPVVGGRRRSLPRRQAGRGRARVRARHAARPEGRQERVQPGRGARGLQQSDDALVAYREANARDSTYADPWLNAGALLARMGRKVEARSAFERYLALAPDSPRAEEIRRALSALAPSGSKKKKSG